MARLESLLNFPVELNKITSGLGTFAYQLDKYELSTEQNIESDYIGPDPRNEVTFVINDMGASLEPLDREVTKQKKPSRSKFQRRQREKNFEL